MQDYSVAFIGTGKPPESSDATGFAMAYKHAESYSRLSNCTLTACADIVRENATGFANEVGIDADNVYEDYSTMLAAAEPDIISICVPPAVHADITLDCLKSGIPQAIHCEKPMADTWKDCRQMVAVANEYDIQLTFNHQRRFGTPFVKAKELLDAGEIGALKRVEFSSPNLFDYGTHSFDLSNFYAEESDPEWVIGQVDYREENVLFGAHNENQGIVQWQYESGVQGLATTGLGNGNAINCHNRLVGTEGVIEIGRGFPTDDSGPMLRIRRDEKSSWEEFDVNNEDVHGRRDAEDWKGQAVLTRALEDVVESIDGEQAPLLSGENALRATELIFGTWESARRHGRIDLPLDIDDNPLISMIESGELQPKPVDD